MPDVHTKASFGIAEGGMTPIPMLLFCPICHAQHIDRDEWARRPHRTHLCEICRYEFRPANVSTVGVETLPPGGK